VFISLRVLLALIGFYFLANVASAAHYKIWFKAFIPNSGLDIVTPVPKSAGHFMIPGPHIAGIPVDNTCYNTNDRSFSTSEDADAKITIISEFDSSAAGVANAKNRTPIIGQTIRFDCTTGTVLNTGTASNQNIAIGEPKSASGIITYTVDADAANPLVALSPSIKIHGTVTLDTNSRSVSFDGALARFPAYEAYISVDNGKPVPIFTISPASDASAWSLFFNVSIDPIVTF